MKTLGIIGMLLTMTLLSCSDEIINQDVQFDDLYFNSFETETDFYGFDLGFPHKEAPLDGGAQSIAISGGCIWPHTMIEVGPFETNKIIFVSVVAKLDASLPKSSTTMESFVGENYTNSNVLSIESTEWKLYATPEFTLQKGESLFLTLNSGGMIAGLAQFDLLRVEQVN